MIKIIHAIYKHGQVIELGFSDGMQGDYDVGSLLERDTELTKPLTNPEYFKRFFIDFGALCWPNSLELSAHAIYQRLTERGALRRSSQVA